MATFSSDGRTVTVSSTAAAASASQQTTQPAPGTTANAVPPNSSQTAEAQPTPAPPTTPTRRYFAVVDASHGGDDHGETLSPTLLEKDVTIALARSLRQELESRGIPTVVLRDNDANLSLDQRAIFTNTDHAAIYIAVHAASNGHGVRVYTALLPYGGDDRGILPRLDHRPARLSTTQPKRRRRRRRRISAPPNCSAQPDRSPAPLEQRRRPGHRRRSRPRSLRPRPTHRPRLPATGHQRRCHRHRRHPRPTGSRPMKCRRRKYRDQVCRDRECRDSRPRLSIERSSIAFAATTKIPGAPFLARSLREKWGCSTERNRRAGPSSTPFAGNNLILPRASHATRP